MNPAILATLVGAVWGCIAYVITLGTYKMEAHAALSGPLFGLLVYLCSRWVYRRRSHLLMIGWSVVKLVAAAGAYGAILGATIYYAEPPSIIGLWLHVRNTAVGCAAGIFVLFPLWALLPLAYVSHLALMYTENDRKQKAPLATGPLPS